MKYQLAPLEGITTYIYRNTYNKYYGGIDEYFSPFISPHKNKTLNSKEIKDILPDNNLKIELIPQIMTNNVDDFINTEKVLIDFGYKKVNLNFGCPSATVTTKGKGAGILKDIDFMDSFLDGIFSKTNMLISIKTRLGFDSYDEWENILKIYEKYPIDELIIHSRLRSDFYITLPNLPIFEKSFEHYNGKIDYNGNVFSKADLVKIENMNSNINAIMIGRGIIANPAMLFEGDKNMESMERFKEFHNEIYEEYKKTQSGDKNVLYRMKELWFYLFKNFKLISDAEKKIKKAKDCLEYEMAVKQIFAHEHFIEDKSQIRF